MGFSPWGSMYILGAVARTLSLNSRGDGQRVPSCPTSIDARVHSDAASSSLLRVSDTSAGQRLAVGVRATPEFSRKAAACSFLLAALVVFFAPTQAEVAWRSVRGADLQTLFADGTKRKDVT